MKRVVAYRIINKSGAAGIITVWIQGSSKAFTMRYPDTTNNNRMNHFIAAVTMLQSDNVHFDPKNKIFEVRQRIKNLENDETLEDFEEFV